MGRMIEIGRQTHVTTMEAYGQVSECMEAGIEIGDDVAATIAALFQSPGEGRAFAALASGRAVEMNALLDAIAVERRYAAIGDRPLLDMLSTWAIRHD